MAGSYKHAVYEPTGELLNNDDFADFIETIGDAYEMAEEMYGMIWLLAGGDAARVEDAHRNYLRGLQLSPGVQP